MPKIKLLRSQCIGCGSCVAVCEKLFEMAEDNFSHLKNSKVNSENIEELEVKEAGCATEAVDMCPVQIIKLES